MKPKLGLALSGGGARGLAHIGVLRVLAQAGIQIDVIGGTSMGGLIAAAYACGVPLEEIERRALLLTHRRELIKLLDLAPPRKGLIEGSRVKNFLADLFLDRNFENLSIPLSLSAVDLISSKEVVFTRGLVFPAVLATIAFPGLFPSVEIGPYRLVDGGVLNNLPVDRVRELGADIVIGVDVQFDPYHERPWQDPASESHFPLPVPQFFLDFYRSEIIMIAELTQTHLKAHPPDVLLRPPLPADVTMFLGFPRGAEIIQAGEICTIEALPMVRALLDQADPTQGVDQEIP